MMNRRISIVLAGIVLLFTTAYGQKKQPKKGEETKSAANGKPVMEVMIGSSMRTGGPISKRDFDSIAPQGITIKDAQGAFIEGFSFTYGERNLYEDSIGKEILVTDYLTEYCMGDTLSAIIASTIAQRTKAGDTAYYDDIHIRLPNGKPAVGKPMKFVITQ